MALDIILASALGSAASTGMPLRGPCALHCQGTTPNATGCKLQASNDTTDGVNGVWIDWPGGLFTANATGFRFDAPRATAPNSGLWFRISNVGGWASVTVSVGLVDI